MKVIAFLQNQEEIAMTTLADEIQSELKRNRELLVQYKEIGPPGTFAFAMIEQQIADTKRAILEADTVQMIRCLESLQNSK